MNGCYIEAMRQIVIGRVVEYKAEIGHLERNSKTGCPQGGTASPCIWNIAMNDLLLNLEKAEIDHLAYADDLALVLTGDTKAQLKL